MSTNRTKRGGWASPRELQKGPNGRNLCRECGTEVPKGRRTFCGDPCVDAWRIKTDPGFMRQKVFERDRGVCAACGFDTEEINREIGRTAREDPNKIGAHGRSRRAVLPRYGIDPRTHRTSYWDADHILPVIEGGGECDLSNLRTLCLPCHRQVTAELAARRAEARRLEQLKERGILTLPGIPPGRRRP